MALDEAFSLALTVDLNRHLGSNLIAQVTLNGGKGSLPRFLSPSPPNPVCNLLQIRRIITGSKLKSCSINAWTIGFEFFNLFRHGRKRFLL
jgi:hypothetical protein